MVIKIKYGIYAIFPNIIKREPTSIGKLSAVWKGVSKDGEKSDLTIQLDAADCEKILRISDEDLKALGFRTNNFAKYLFNL